MKMDIGKIDSRHNFLTHKITQEILKLVKEHPDYPIAVLCSEDCNSGDYCWQYSSSVHVEIGELLECNSGWWSNEYVCTDRDDFENHCADIIYDKLFEELDREPTEVEQEEAWGKVKEAHEPYWVKCICIYADN